MARERIERFLEVGVTHFILGVSAPFDHTALRRFAERVMPTFRGQESVGPGGSDR